MPSLLRHWAFRIALVGFQGGGGWMMNEHSACRLFDSISTVYYATLDDCDQSVFKTSAENIHTKNIWVAHPSALISNALQHFYEQISQQFFLIARAILFVSQISFIGSTCIDDRLKLFTASFNPVSGRTGHCSGVHWALSVCREWTKLLQEDTWNFRSKLLTFIFIYWHSVIRSSVFVIALLSIAVRGWKAVVISNRSYRFRDKVFNNSADEVEVWPYFCSSDTIRQTNLITYSTLPKLTF